MKKALFNEQAKPMNGSTRAIHRLVDSFPDDFLM